MRFPILASERRRDVAVGYCVAGSESHPLAMSSARHTGAFVRADAPHEGPQPVLLHRKDVAQVGARASREPLGSTHLHLRGRAAEGRGDGDHRNGVQEADQRTPRQDQYGTPLVQTREVEQPALPAVQLVAIPDRSWRCAPAGIEHAYCCLLDPPQPTPNSTMKTLDGVPLPDHLLCTIREQDAELHRMLRTAADLERQTETLRRQLAPPSIR